jgi:putative chitinase
MQVNHDAFFERYTNKYGRLNTGQRAGLEALLSHIEQDAAIEDVRWVAYMLATVKHECADRWQPIEEFGKGKGQPYGREIIVHDAAGKAHGNCYYGRGYVQLTWDHNYQRIGQALGLGDDLLIHPELALEPETAYRIMSYGMTRGTFTGKKLSDYIDGAACDYRNARRIINGQDQWARIKGYAETLEAVLVESASPHM